MTAFTSLSLHEPAQRVALLTMLLSAAAVLYCLTVLLNQFHNPGLVNDPHFIALLAAIAIFTVSAIVGLVICCCKNSNITEEKVKGEHYLIRYDYHFKHSTAALITLAAISLISAAAFFGSIVRNAHDTNILGAICDTANPLCIGLYIFASILLVSILALAIKNIISPESSNDYIFIHDNPLPKETIDKICENVDNPSVVCFISPEQLSSNLGVYK